MAENPLEVLKSFGVLPGQPPVEQAGGVPVLELDLKPISPDTAMDADYAESILEGRAQDALIEEQAQMAADAGPTPQSTLFPAPEKPSAIAAGMEAGGRVAGEGVRAIVDGLRALVRVGPSPVTANVLNLPQKDQAAAIPDPMQATRQILMEGLIGLAMSPLVAAFGAAGQGLDNLSPEAARAVVFEGGAAYTFNHLLAGAPAPGTITPEQAATWKEPVTVRGVLEAVGPLVAPLAPKGVKKVGLAVEIQRPNLKSERGSIGGRPEPSKFEGRPGSEPSSAPKQPPPPIATTPQEFNAKTWYHGTGTEGLTATSLNPLLTSAEGLFGQGVYLTDSPTIAEGYAKARATRRGTPSVYEVKVNIGKVLRAEDAIEPQVSKVFLDVSKGIDSAFGGDVGEAVKAAASKPGATVESVWQTLSKAVEELSHTEEIPSGEFLDSFSELAAKLKTLGYDGLTYTGGKRTGKAPHQVLLLFDPNESHAATGRAGQVSSFQARASASGGGAGQPPPPSSGPTVGGATGEGGAGGQTFTPGESRLNTARMNVEQDVKNVAARVNALMAERLAASRKTRTHAETIAEGEALHLTVEEALALDPLTVPLADVRKTQQALRDLHAAAASHLADVGKRAAAGEKGLDAEGWAAFDLAAELSIKQEVTGTEGGRIVEARKIGAESERSPFDPDAFMRLREQTAGAPRGDFATMARRLTALPGGVKGVRARSFMGQVWEGLKLGKDMTYELWINWLLTNPETHVANMGGTGLTTAWEIPEHAFAEAIHRMFSSDPKGVQAGETAAMLRSGMRALSDGFRLAGKAAQRAAELTPAERKLLSQTPLEERPRMISSAMVAERMGWDVDNVFGRALDVLGRAANLPTTGLGIEDGFWKGVNYRLELSALAVREAKAEGLTGKALERRVKQIELNPDATTQAEAIQASMVRTLNAELGPRGQAFMTFMNFPGGRVAAPFLRTPINSFKWFGQRAPILAQLSAKNRADILAGGAAREMAIARQALGAAFTALIAYEVSQGNVTGGGPTDKWLRKMQRDPATTTKPPYSIRLGGQGGDYVNLARFDPVFGTFVGAVADYMELAGKIPYQDGYDEWAAYGEALVIATGHMLVNKTHMRSASAMLDAINDPDRNFGKIASSYGRTVVPAGLRKLTRVMDDNVIREVRGVTDAIKSGLPYYVDDVPVDRNPITGDAVEYPPGWGPDLLSPVLVFPNNDDPVFKELIANEIRLTPVPRALGGTAETGPLMKEARPGPPIPLDAAQRDYWKLAMTKHARVVNGKLLHEALTDLVTSPRYQQQSTGPRGGRDIMFSATYHAYWLKGREMLMDASSSLKEARKTQAVERGRAKLPVTDPRSPQYGAKPGLAEELIKSLGR